MLLKYKKILPKVEKDVFIAAGSYVIGDVRIGSKSSVWFNVVIRGDVEKIKIGSNTNIQDLTMIHCTTNGHGTQIGSNVTILPNLEVKQKSIVGAGAVVTSDVPAKSTVVGNPAKLRNSFE